jgi:hypothetical protein
MVVTLLGLSAICLATADADDDMVVIRKTCTTWKMK